MGTEQLYARGNPIYPKTNYEEDNVPGKIRRMESDIVRMQEVLDYMADRIANQLLEKSEVAMWARQQTKPVYTAAEVGADIQGSARGALMESKEYADGVYSQAVGYTDLRIGELIGGAPEALDTLKKIADALSSSETVVEALNRAITEKASEAEYQAHAGNETIHIKESERSRWNNTGAELSRQIKYVFKEIRVYSYRTDTGAVLKSRAACPDPISKGEVVAVLEDLSYTNAEGENVESWAKGFYKAGNIVTETDAASSIIYYIPGTMTKINESDFTIGQELNSVAHRIVSLSNELQKIYSSLMVHIKDKNNPHGLEKTDLGLSNVENKSSAMIRSELTRKNVTDALGYVPSVTDTTYEVATTSSNGLMSAADKVKVNGFDDKIAAVQNYVYAVEGVANTAWAHISDNIKHITADERASWNSRLATAGGTMMGTLRMHNASIILTEGYNLYFGQDFGNRPNIGAAYRMLYLNSGVTDMALMYGVLNSTWTLCPTSAYTTLGIPAYRWGQIYSTVSSISTSDRREKTDIEDINYGDIKGFLKDLKPVYYRLIKHPSKKYAGLIAQDVEATMIKHKIPQDFGLLDKAPDYDKDGNLTGDYIYGLCYDQLITLMLLVLQNEVLKD